jgi:hypothetical protein
MFDFFGSFQAFSFSSWLKRTFETKQSFWLNTWLHSRFKSRRPAGVQRRRFQLECLEDRTMPSVSVTLDTSNLMANATAIVINGSG